MTIPPDLQSVPDLLRTQARRIPDQPLVRSGDTVLTYGEFDARTDDIATGLADLGIKPGDMVSVFLPNSIAFLEAWWGILKAGGVFGPVNPAFTGNEAGYVISHSEAKAVFTDANGAEILSKERERIPDVKTIISVDSGGDMLMDDLRGKDGPVPEHGRGRTDLAQVLYTSGTTGSPKGAMVTHGNVLADTAMAGELVPLGPGDRLGMILPLFHANAQIATFTIPMMIGAEVVMWDRFSASNFWATVEQLEPVSISAVPTILGVLLDAPGAPTNGKSSLRYVICGAAPLSVEMLEAFESRFGLRILEGYGLTESTCVSSINPFFGERKAGSIGLPIRGQDMKIVDPEGAEVPKGELGEIILRGPNIMPGYLKNPEATAETIRDGWLYTGDVGYEDEDGYFFIVDRSKDMIIRGGENIYPREIEEVLYTHPGVIEAAVIGLPDTVRGEEVLAVVVPKSGAEIDPEEVVAYCAERLARFKVPKQVVVRDEMPKTATGKISKGPLREEFGSIWG